MTAFAHIASHVAQADRRPTEDVGNHDHGRPGTPLLVANRRLRTMENGLGESLWDCQVWNASTQDVVNSIGDDGSTRSG